MPALRQSSARFAVFFLALLLKPSYIAGCLTLGLPLRMPFKDFRKGIHRSFKKKRSS